MQRLGGNCARCGAMAQLEIHHVTPLSEGGTNAITNLQVLCRNCHIEHHRGNATPGRGEWLDLIGVGGRHRRG